MKMYKRTRKKREAVKIFFILFMFVNVNVAFLLGFVVFSSVRVFLCVYVCTLMKISKMLREL